MRHPKKTNAPATPVFGAFLALLLCACEGTGTTSDSGGGPCTDSGMIPGTDANANTDAGATDAGTMLECMTMATSDLMGVRMEFPDQQCVFTLAEAAAGIDIDYDVIVESMVDNVIPEAQDAGQCDQPHTSGLILFARLIGGGQSYCICDSGLCAPPPGTPVQLLTATYAATFSWMGRNWGGPSDTGNPMGAAFPPGTYTLTASAVGTRNGIAFSVSATFLVHLVP